MNAIAFGVNFSTGDIKYQFFSDSKNPANDAWSFIESIQDDFPDHTFTVLADEAAEDVLKQYRLKQYGMD